MQDKKIESVLIALVDDKEVFSRRYPDTYKLQEIGLDAAEDAVSGCLDIGDLEPEEMALIHQLRNKKRRGKNG
jgi:hypothetical protein